MDQKKKTGLRSAEVRSMAACIAVSAVLFAFFYSLVPLGSDDWGWGGTEGYTRLTEFFSGYNGRYLGNLTVIAMTRSKALRVAVMTVTTVLIGCMTAYYTSRRFSWKNYLLTNFLLMLSIAPGFINSHMNLFSSTLGWVSGFSNYVCPAVPILAYIIYADRDFARPGLTHGKRGLPLLFLLGFASCLYVENITFFCLFLGAAVNIYFYAVRRKLYASHMAYFAGTVLGGAAMLINPAYYHMLLGEYVGDSLHKNKFREVGLISSDSVSQAVGRLNLSPFIQAALAAAVLLLAAAAAVMPLILKKDRESRLRLYAPLIFAVMLTLPLLFANGGHYYIFTIRIYFLTYVILILYALQILSAAGSGLTGKWRNALGVIAACALCVCAAFVISLYYGIHQVESAMEEHLAEQLEDGARSVEVIMYPERYERFLYAPNSFTGEEWGLKFKDYYGIDPDTELVPVPYDEYTQREAAAEALPAPAASLRAGRGPLSAACTAG